MTTRSGCVASTSRRAVREQRVVARPPSAPTSTASTRRRRSCTSRARASPVIHRDVPSGAATLPSSDAASLSVTNGRRRRDPLREGLDQRAWPRPRRSPTVDLDARVAQHREAAAVDLRIGVGDRRDDARDAGVDQQLGARTRASTRCCRARGSRRRSRRERARRRARARRSSAWGPGLRRVQPSPTTSPSATRRRRRPADAATRGPRRARASSSARSMYLVVVHCRLPSRRDGDDRWTYRSGREAEPPAERQVHRPPSLIRTFTVGPGISPGRAFRPCRNPDPELRLRGLPSALARPPDHRRWGISPRPEGVPNSSAVRLTPTGRS